MNPHRLLGLQKATVDWKSELEAEDGVKQVLRVEAAPGHPVCPRGHGPLRVHVPVQLPSQLEQQVAAARAAGLERSGSPPKSVTYVRRPAKVVSMYAKNASSTAFA